MRCRKFLGGGCVIIPAGASIGETIVMGRNLQLRINEPCNESWERMEAGEGGRFCGACSKVVVDFSVMSDREILQYLSRARGGVCGRLGADQLDRDILLGEEEKRRKWMGWGVLVASLLFGSRGLAQQRQLFPSGAKGTNEKEQGTTLRRSSETHQVPVDAGVCKDVEGGSARVNVADVGGKKGEVAVKVDSFKVLPTVTVQGFRVMGKTTVAGGLMYCVKPKTITALKEKVLDSLALLGVPVKRELGVYPNPVRRGTVVSLSWKAEPGQYQIGLFNSAGALLEQELLEVRDGGQVDLFEIPAVLPGGVYFLRAVKAGGGREITKKIVVI